MASSPSAAAPVVPHVDGGEDRHRGQQDPGRRSHRHRRADRRGGCPFCSVMMSDAVAAKQQNGQAEGVEVTDVARLMLQAAKSE